MRQCYPSRSPSRSAEPAASTKEPPLADDNPPSSSGSLLDGGGARLLLKGTIPIAVFLGLAWVLTVSGASIDEAWVDAEVRGRGLSGELLFVVTAAAVLAVGVPRQLAGFLGGYAFGVVHGTALALVAMLIACVVDFFGARLMGRKFVQARLGPRLGRADAFLRDHPFTTTVAIRLLPAGSNFLINLFAGVSSVRPGLFFAGSALGYIPQALIFALLGSGVNVDTTARVSLGIVLFLVSAGLALHLFRQVRRSARQDLAPLGTAPAAPEQQAG